MNTSNVPGPLGFNYWPFDIVPRQGELVWADRLALKHQVEQLGRRLGRHQAVSLHLLWADFGAGKTHTLLYIKQEAEKGNFGSLLPLYCALPKGCRDFIDIYRAMVRAIPFQLLRNAYAQAVKNGSREQVEAALANIWANLPRCFQTIAIGGEEQQRIALAWLQAETGLVTRDLRGISIIGRIRSTDDAVLALAGIIRLFNLAGHKRVLLMVDEFQRVEVLRRQQQDDINAGLHGFFNACGYGMSLLLSFSFGVEENIRHFLNRELLSRVDPLRISIPMLTNEEGVSFLNDVLDQARDVSREWPVSGDVVPAIVSAVAERFQLTPRRLLKAAGLVFELAGMDLENTTIPALNSTYVKSMDVRGDFSRIDEQEGEE
ncbi:MAG: BREX system ATP-binding domain-containing protein [Candidatus Acidiferrum sp.]